MMLLLDEKDPAHLLRPRHLEHLPDQPREDLKQE
jgi:hypothetical protein